LAITREKKEELVQEYTERLNGSEAVIITDYRGLTVPEIQALRAEIRKVEGGFSVVKNSLARLALQEAGLPVVDEMLIGPVGMGFCNQNITGVAKAVTDFAKANDKLEVKGGLLGDQIMDEAAIKSLASLPTIEVLRAQLLGVINAPATQLTGIIAGSVRQVVNVVNAYAEKDADATVAAEAE
jgi:large subunit ribosomal protein L10